MDILTIRATSTLQKRTECKIWPPSLVDSPRGTRLRYHLPMTELLTKAFDALNKLPADRQDELAPFLLALADNAPLTPEEAKAIAEVRADSAREGLAPNETVRAFWASLRL